MEKEFNYTEIENYVKKEMSANSRAAFEQRLQADTDLASEVRFYEEVVQVAELQGLFEEAEEELEAEQKSEAKVVSMKKTRQIKPARRFLALAASLAVVVIAGIFLWNAMNSSNQDYFAQYYQPYPNDIAPITKGEDLPKTTLAEALQAYERKNYGQARTLFSTLPTSDTIQFYSSIIDLEEGNMSAAIDNLNTLNQSESTFQQAADWYLALAYLKNKETLNAKELLEKITANDRHLFKRRAEELLEAL